MHPAAFFGNKDAIEILLNNKANSNAKAIDDSMPLHAAASYSGNEIINHKKIAELLKLHGGHE